MPDGSTMNDSKFGLAESSAPPSVHEKKRPHRRRRRLPVLRSECLPGGANAQRPCPYVSCRHHLAIVRINVPNSATRDDDLIRLRDEAAGGDEAWQVGPTCSLDVAEQGPHAFAAVGAAIGRTAEMARLAVARAIGRYLANGGDPEALRVMGITDEER